MIRKTEPDWCSGRNTQAALAGFEDGRRSHWPKKEGGFWKWKRERNGFFPVFQKECSPADTLLQPRETCFGLLTNRTVRESICVVSSHKGGGDLSQQPQEMSTSCCWMVFAPRVRLAQVTGNGEAPGRLHAECPRCGGNLGTNIPQSQNIVGF